MTKKKIIIIAVILLALLTISSIILARTEEFSVKAFSLFGVMVTGYGLIVLGLFSLGRIGKLPVKRSIILRRNLFNVIIIFAVFFFIMSMVQIISAEDETTSKHVLGIVFNIGLAITYLITGISGRLQLKKELLKLSEVEDEGNDNDNGDSDSDSDGDGRAGAGGID